MGRYDERIKVYHEGAWKPVKQLRVHQGGRWLDLGTNDSDNARELLVHIGGESKRVTRNRHEKAIQYVNSLGYHIGNAKITTLQQYCFNNSGGATNREFNINMKVKASGACTLVSFSTGSNFSFKAGIKSDGTVYYELKDKAYAKNTYTHNAGQIQMGFDKDWQTVKFYGGVKAGVFKVIVNGVTSQFSIHTAWDAKSWGGSTGTFGANNLRIATDGSFIINTANAPFTTLTEVKETVNDVEVSWV